MSLELKSSELDGEDLTRQILACENKVHCQTTLTLRTGVSSGTGENSLKELEAIQKVFRFAPSATSYGMGWKELQALRYCNSHTSELSVAITPMVHLLVLHVRPPAKMDLRYEGVKRETPPPGGSIAVVPAGSSVLMRWQGSMDVLHVLLDPTLVARVAAESFEFDSTRTVVPPLDGLNVPELRSAMLAVDAELRAGGVGGPLMVEALATMLSVQLIRHTTGAPRLPVSAASVLPRRKLRTVIEYILENLGSSLTLERMAAVVHISPYHFARQFKAATGLPPHQYVIARRVKQAQQLLRADGKLGLGEVAFRVGFADQSKFSFHFKRTVGVTPGQFRISVSSYKKSSSGPISLLPKERGTRRQGRVYTIDSAEKPFRKSVIETRRKNNALESP